MRLPERVEALLVRLTAEASREPDPSRCRRISLVVMREKVGGELAPESVPARVWDTGGGDVSALEAWSRQVARLPRLELPNDFEAAALAVVGPGEKRPDDAVVSDGVIVFDEPDRLGYGHFAVAIDRNCWVYVHSLLRELEPVRRYTVVPPPGRVPKMLRILLAAIIDGAVAVT